MLIQCQRSFLKFSPTLILSRPQSPAFFGYLDSDMVREWPRRQEQTKAALKKEKPLGEKVLADVRRKVSQIEKMLEPVMENASLARNSTKELERATHTLAKV